MPDRAESSAIESGLHERRLFSPAPEFAERAHVRTLDEYRALHKRSIEDPEGFWAEAAGHLEWFSPWKKVLEWKAPDAKWFVGATTNLCHNCVDRHVKDGHGDETAVIWEGEPMQPAGPETAHITYADLQRETAKFGNVLKSLGVRKGDVVTIYMPMIPELAVAVLACARIGAVHSVIFGGFSASAIADRVHDAKSRVIVTADGGWRRGKIVPLKDNVDAACTQIDTIDHVVVVQRTGEQTVWHAKPSDSHGGKRDHWWHDLMAAADENCPCEHMDSEDPLFVLYTSGTTGKPKGILHTTGGYMVQTALTAKVVFDLKPGEDVYWCTADLGWVTGHSYIVYGVMPNRVPTLMYEGAPDYPDKDRFWSIVARHKVSKFYTAPTAIRAFMKWGEEHPKKHDLSSLRVLGTVGEPINPEAWMWYHRVIGAERCPIVDTWWQTETGGHMITPLPGATPTKPGSCTLPFFGVDAAIVNDQGEEQPLNSGGLLAIRRPWPSMLRGILGDRQRFIDTYWSRIRNDKGEPYYFAGDGARRDEDGYFWIMGRVDDVINVSGHRLGTMEVESALVSHEAVVEAAVVGMPHEIKGTGIAAFVTLAPGFEASEALRTALRAHVGEEIGAIAKPDQIRFAEAVPKTRSGKIMRRLLRDIAAGRADTGDTTTLEDFSVLAKLRESEES
ncbi:MAG: acetate--CoA ligase [Phycisphaeraceae bacterium]|nr:MAG: acetate--CoA ligase [Phycisphaeraceae bacterium]